MLTKWPKLSATLDHYRYVVMVAMSSSSDSCHAVVILLLSCRTRNAVTPSSSFRNRHSIVAMPSSSYCLRHFIDVFLSSSFRCNPAVLFQSWLCHLVVPSSSLCRHTIVFIHLLPYRRHDATVFVRLSSLQLRHLIRIITSSSYSQWRHRRHTLIIIPLASCHRRHIAFVIALSSLYRSHGHGRQWRASVIAKWAYHRDGVTCRQSKRCVATYCLNASHINFYSHCKIGSGGILSSSKYWKTLRNVSPRLLKPQISRGDRAQVQGRRPDIWMEVVQYVWQPVKKGKRMNGVGSGGKGRISTVAKRHQVGSKWRVTFALQWH